MNEVTKTEGKKTIVNLPNILLILIISMLLYLVYSVIFTIPNNYVTLPPIDISKKLNELSEDNKRIYKRQDSLNTIYLQLSDDIKNSKNTVKIIYKNLDDEKEFIQNSNDSVNYIYFLDYLDKYKGTN